MNIKDDELDLFNKNYDDINDLIKKLIKSTQKPSLRYSLMAGSGIQLIQSALGMCNTIDNLDFQIKQIDLKFDEMKVDLRKKINKQETDAKTILKSCPNQDSQET